MVKSTQQLNKTIDEQFERNLMTVIEQTHITEEELDLYAHDNNDEFLKARVKAHIKSCVMCRIDVETIEEYRYGLCGEELEKARAKIEKEKLIVPLKTQGNIFNGISTWINEITPGFFAVPLLAAAVGEWSKEERFFYDKAGYIWREVGDGRMEQHFTLDTEEAHQIQWVGDDWVKEVVLEKGPFGWSGTLILAVEERKKLDESTKAYLNVI